MENRSHALLAGLFLLILGAAAVTALWWFSGRQDESRQYIVETHNNVTGLNAQAQVRYRGIRVGKVESIRLDPANPRSTLIDISVRKDIPITRSTTAKLGYQGVTGLAHVLLEDDGSDTVPLPDDAKSDVRIVMQDSLVQELADAGGDIMRQTRELLDNMNELLNKDNRQAVSRTLANLDVSSRHARETSERLQQLLNQESIQRIHATLAHTEQTMAQAGPFFAEARGLVTRLQTATVKFETALGDANSGGVASLVPRFNELTADFATTTQQLNRVLRMLEESPQSLIFGPRGTSPGPGEPGFSVPKEERAVP